MSEICKSASTPPQLSGTPWPLRTRELENTDHRIVGFLSSRTGKIDPLVLRSESERIEITGSYVLAVDDGNAYLEAGLAGLGVIALPVYMAAAHQARGALIPLFEHWRLAQCPCIWRFRRTAMSMPDCAFY